MEKSIYDIMNRVHTNLEEYKEVKLSEYENKKNTKRILSKIKGKQSNVIRRQRVLKKVGVAIMIAVLGVTSATSVSFATEGEVFKYLYTFFHGSGITVEFDKTTGVTNTTVEMNATRNPPVKLEENKLYYIGNGSKIDITNEISNSTPYINEYTDEQNVVHKFIIGGEPFEGSYGYEENLFDGEGMFIGASGYYGSNIQGIGSEYEPEWVVNGRKKIGRTGY